MNAVFPRIRGRIPGRKWPRAVRFLSRAAVDRPGEKPARPRERSAPLILLQARFPESRPVSLYGTAWGSGRFDGGWGGWATLFPQDFTL